jgi:hypothetical protein
VKALLLLVTWLVYDQPPSSYQVSFQSLEMCEAARDAVLMERERLKQEVEQRDAQRAREPGVIYAPPEIPPAVSAICVAQ